MRARLIREVGTRAWLRTFSFSHIDKCPGNEAGYHDALAFLAASKKPRDWSLGGQVEDHPDFAFPTHCDHCGTDMMMLEHHRQVFRRRKYSTESGNPEPGTLFYADWTHSGNTCIHGWENCKRPHLIAVLPNGHYWDIDSRASNCTLPTDFKHRCWVRKGRPPRITVGKDGLTCAAGAGSVVGGNWHGFLIDGVFREA